MCGLNCHNVSETAMDVVFGLDRELRRELLTFLSERATEELDNTGLKLEDYVFIENFDLSYDPRATREEGRYEFKFDITLINTPEWEEGNEESETLSFVFPPKFSKENLYKRVWNKIVTRAKLEEKGFKKFDLDYHSWL